MKKSELIKNVASATNMSIINAKLLVNATIDAIADGLANDHKVTIPRLGLFFVTETQPRKGINPATLESVNIPSQRRVRFHASDILKNQLNQNK